VVKWKVDYIVGRRTRKPCGLFQELSDLPSSFLRYLCAKWCTDYLKCNRKDDKHFHEKKEGIEPKVVAGSHTVRDPWTMMVVDTHTPLANLAMSRSIRFNQLLLRGFTIQSKQIFEGCVVLSISKSFCSASTMIKPGYFREAIKNKMITMIPIIKYEKARSPLFGKC